MRVKSALFLLFAGASVAVAACTTPVDLAFPGTPTPSGTTPITPTPTAVASAVPVDTEIFGVVNQCWALEAVGGGGFPQVFTGDLATDRQLVLTSDGSGAPGGSSTLVIWQVVGLAGQQYQRVVVRHTAAAADKKIHVTLEDEDPEGTAVEFLTQYGGINRPAQACTFPRWGNVTIVGDVVASAWSDTTQTGGIVAFEATGSVLAVGGGIDVSGQGFPGGAASVIASPPMPCTTPVANSSSPSFAGRRGEGFVSPALGFGNENAGNGGGGGSCRDFGGGGGGGGGKGGDGGDGGTDVYIGGGGLGGESIGPADRLVMGGGGGAGHHSLMTDAEPGTAGGNGGGVVWIIAGSYTDDSGNEIRANGTSQSVASSDGHGLGGGGGGGTVRLDSIDPGVAVSIFAIGAAGASSGLTAPCGAGGGGGGGRIFAPADAVKLVTGGPAGVCMTVPNPGAGPGAAGITP